MDKISFLLDAKLPQTSFYHFPELLASHMGEKPVAVLTLIIDVLLPRPHGIRRNSFASALTEKEIPLRLLFVYLGKKTRPRGNDHVFGL